MVVASLIEGEWSCCKSGQLNGGRMVMLWRWPVQTRDNGLCYRGSLFNGGGMAVTEVASLKEAEWSSYRGGQFNIGRMIMVQR